MSYIIGIDLGTSNSCVAVVEDGKSHVIPDTNGRKVQPSVISFYPDGSHVVGYEAKTQMVYNPENTVFSTKRLIGRTFSSSETERFAENMPYKLVKGSNNAVMVEAQGQIYSLTEISSLIISHMKSIAEEYLGEKVEKAVVTVPANFNELQRNATKMAGDQAGLEIVRVINEPTAAALAYGFGQGLEQKVMVYDFGGGTFDCTILNLSGDVFEVLSTAGDTFLGGDDIDNKICQLVVNSYKNNFNIDLTKDPLAMLRIRYEAENVKIILSSEKNAQMKIPSLAYSDKGAVDLNVSLSRDNFNVIGKELVESTFEVCDKALKTAGLVAAEIDNTILVGGTTNIPLVRDMVQLHFGTTPFWGVNPEEVVAIGAAIQGAIIGGATAIAAGADGDNQEPMADALLLDVTPLTLGVGTLGGRVEPLIPRNTPLPTDQSKIFTTANDGQTTVRIRVYQGESEFEDENEQIGVLVLNKLRPGIRGDVQIEVTFEIDINGIVNVSAVDLDTGQKQAVRLNLVGKHNIDESDMMSNDATAPQVR